MRKFVAIGITLLLCGSSSFAQKRVDAGMFLDYLSISQTNTNNFGVGGRLGYLASFDRAALLCVLQDLYAADESNRAFLHARFGLGEDPLHPYKETIDRCLWPNFFRGEQPSVSRATGAITRYKKALGDPVGLAELLVFYCERGAGFCQDVHHEDVAYFDALVRTFAQALKATANLTGNIQKRFLAGWITFGRLVVNSVMELARTWMFCFPSSIYRLKPGVFHGNRN